MLGTLKHVWALGAPMQEHTLEINGGHVKVNGKKLSLEKRMAILQATYVLADAVHNAAIDVAARCPKCNEYLGDNGCVTVGCDAC